MVYCNSEVLIGLQAMVYELIYRGQHIIKVGVRVSENSREGQMLQFFGYFNKTIIPLTVVGYASYSHLIYILFTLFSNLGKYLKINREGRRGFHPNPTPYTEPSTSVVPRKLLIYLVSIFLYSVFPL